MALELEVVRTVAIRRSASAIGRVGCGPGDDQGEFVAADAGEKSAVGGGGESLRHIVQQRVAGRMAEHVVDVLEAVEVEAQDGERDSRGRRALQREVEALGESRAVRQVGQRVVIGKVGDPRGGALALGYVLGDAEQVFRFSIVAVDRKPLRQDVAHPVVAGADRLFLDNVQTIGAQHFLVAKEEEIGLLPWQEIVVALADQLVAGNAEQLLAGPVHQDIAVLLRLLDEQHGRHVLDDGVEKLTGAAQFVIGPLALGDVDDATIQARAPLILQRLAYASTSMALPSALMWRQLRSVRKLPLRVPTISRKASASSAGLMSSSVIARNCSRE